MILPRAAGRLAMTMVLACSTAAAAHVTVWPKQSTTAQHERYLVRLPNEKAVATVALELRFPEAVRVISFEQKPGWTAAPVKNDKGATIAVRWSGALPPAEFVELGLIAVNGAAPGELVWTATQTYADGTVVSWSGAKGSRTPAPRTALVAAEAPPAHRH